MGPDDERRWGLERRREAQVFVSDHCFVWYGRAAFFESIETAKVAVVEKKDKNEAKEKRDAPRDSTLECLL
jgi:hypothetical protein